MTRPGAFGMSDEELQEKLAPRWVAAAMTWLASAESAGITGRVIDVSGMHLGIAEGWHLGPIVDPVDNPTKVGVALADLVSRARPNATVFGVDPA